MDSPSCMATRAEDKKNGESYQFFLGLVNISVGGFVVLLRKICNSPLVIQEKLTSCTGEITQNKNGC